MGVDDQPISSLQYDPQTARIGPHLWGFGIAYPNSSVWEGRTFYDVSLASFQSHIEKNIASILHDTV
jgi:hypothetical protein